MTKAGRGATAVTVAGLVVASMAAPAGAVVPSKQPRQWVSVNQLAVPRDRDLTEHPFGGRKSLWQIYLPEGRVTWVKVAVPRGCNRLNAEISNNSDSSGVQVRIRPVGSATPILSPRVLAPDSDNEVKVRVSPGKPYLVGLAADPITTTYLPSLWASFFVRC